MNPQGHASPEIPGDSHWYVCRTRSRAEKQVERLIASAGFGVYLPVVERERRWSDRIRHVGFPLFPGYIFVRFRLDQLLTVLRTPGVSSILRHNGFPTPVREEELASVRVLVQGANQSGVAPVPVDFMEPGEDVLVVSGPFQGMRGQLLEERGSTRVVVQIWAMKQATSVELGRELVVPARPRARGLSA